MDIVGKPSPHLFQLGCKALGMAPEEVVMLGDNPMTDIAGAQALGMQAILTSARSPHVFDALAKGRGG
jgi:4-nitrophenyl phosphatase